MNTAVKVMLCLLVTLVSLVGCGVKEDGSVALVLDGASVESVVPKQILPGTNMVLHHYSISFTGATTKTVNDITGPTVQVNGLIGGIYTITVKGYNNDATPLQIGEGVTNNVLVVAGEITAATVNVLPMVGNGTFTANVGYPVGLSNPVLTSTLTPIPTATATSVTFAAPVDNGIKVTRTGTTALMNGWYVMRTLLDVTGGTFSAFYDYVRIVKDATTPFTWNVGLSEGGSGVTINPIGFEPPLEVTFSVAPAATRSITSDVWAATVAVTGVAPTDLMYQWYFDDNEIMAAGVNKPSISSSNMNWATGLVPGPAHLLTVMVTTASGAFRCGAVHATVAVTP